MDDIIEIKVETPYLRPNFKYIVDRMEADQLTVLIDGQKDVAYLGSNITRRGYSFGMTKVGPNTWRISLQEKKKNPKRGIQDELKNVSEDYIEKAEQLFKGKKIEMVNRGQVVYLMGIYKRLKPKDKRSFKFIKNKNGYSMWLEEK